MTDKKNSTKKETMDAAALVEQTTIADIYRAAFYLDNVAIKTKLIESPFFSSICENTVLLKPELKKFPSNFRSVVPSAERNSCIPSLPIRNMQRRRNMSR